MKYTRALLAAAGLLFSCSVSGFAQTVHPVLAGGDFQAALNAARPGDTITLAAGVTYVGNFTLPAKTGEGWITIRSNASDAVLPAAGARIGPQHSPYLPKLRSPNTGSALTTAAGAHHYRLLFLEFLANVNGAGDIIALGDGSSRQKSLDTVPHNLIIDRVYVHGDPAVGQKRGIALNSASTQILNSYISDIKAVGQDSQTICGWNGPGPYLISNNYLEGAGENVMFGGADPWIPDLVPSDITMEGNHLSKPWAWRGSQWLVKNLLELKNARRVLIRGNLLENNWPAAQTGYAILFKSVNQDGRAPWSVVEHVQFTNNVVRRVSSAINLLGREPRYAALEMNNVTFRNNLFTEVSSAKYGGAGRFLLINGGTQIRFDHNTAITDGATTVYGDGNASSGFSFTNNLILDNGAAFHGSDTAPGNGAISRYFPGAQIVANIIAGSNPRAYPAANYYPAITGIGFADPVGGNFRLASTSLFARGGTDGEDPGHLLDAPPFRGPSPPLDNGAPSGLSATVDGSTVRLDWTAPSSVVPTTYVLEAGTTSGASNAAHSSTGNAATSLTVTNVPAGVYYVRVRAVTGSHISEASPEIVVRVGPNVACDGAPQSPRALNAAVVRQQVAINWAPPAGGCTPSHYVLLAGSAPGLSNVAQAAIAAQGLSAEAAEGTYYVRVVAVNEFGTSAPSHEIVVRLQP